MATTLQPPEFRCSVRRTRRGVTLIPVGELDLASAHAFETSAEDALDAGVRSLVVDLRALTYLDSAGLRSLLALAERARRAGADLALVPGSANVMRVFEITGTWHVLAFGEAAA